MFNGKKIESLEQSVTTLTEGLEKANNTIEALFSNFEEVVEKLNDVRSENDKLKEELKGIKEKDVEFTEKFDLVCIKQAELLEKYNVFKKAFEENYAARIDRTFEEINEKSDKDKSAIREEIKKVADVVTKLEEKSNNADKEHDELLAILKDNNERLIKKCEELQLSNVQIMNQHNDMIKRYEQSIKEYAEQTQNMKNNILKKMNANNIISVVEE